MGVGTFRWMAIPLAPIVRPEAISTADLVTRDQWPFGLQATAPRTRTLCLAIARGHVTTGDRFQFSTQPSSPMANSVRPFARWMSRTEATRLQWGGIEVVLQQGPPSAANLSQVTLAILGEDGVKGPDRKEVVPWHQWFLAALKIEKQQSLEVVQYSTLGLLFGHFEMRLQNPKENRFSQRPHWPSSWRASFLQVL